MCGKCGRKACWGSEAPFRYGTSGSEAPFLRGLGAQKRHLAPGMGTVGLQDCIARYALITLCN